MCFRSRGVRRQRLGPIRDFLRATRGRLRGLIKRPGVWALGILGTVATGYVTASLNDLTKSVGGYVSELSCQWRKPSLASDEPMFTILVAKLYKDDGEDTHTRRVFETFQGERGFRSVLLCDTLKFDFRPGEEIKQAEEATIKRGQGLIVQHKADLLIFGEVLLTGNSIRIFAINEHGGCDTRPKPTVLRNGVLPDEFDQDTRIKVIKLTLQEIASACDSEEYVDWDLFEKRILKIGPFLERSAAGNRRRDVEAPGRRDRPRQIRDARANRRHLIPSTGPSPGVADVGRALQLELADSKLIVLEREIGELRLQLRKFGRRGQIR